MHRDQSVVQSAREKSHIPYGASVRIFDQHLAWMRSAAATRLAESARRLALFRGTRLALAHECRPRPPWNLAGSVAAEGHPEGTLCCTLLPCPGTSTGPIAAQSRIKHQPPTRTQTHRAEIKCCVLNFMPFSVKSATSTMLEFLIHPRLARPSVLDAADQMHFAHAIAVETQFGPF